jgi:hypothetical protein
MHTSTANFKTVEDELHTLFTTEQGRETSLFKTILDDRYHSECSSGICTLNLLQIYLDNAVTKYRAKVIPRRLGDNFVSSQSQIIWMNITDEHWFYSADNLLPIAHNLYAITSPLTHDLSSILLILIKLQNQLYSIGNHNFIACGNTPFNVTIFYRTIDYDTYGTYTNNTLSMTARYHLIFDPYKITAHLKDQNVTVYNSTVMTDTHYFTASDQTILEIMENDKKMKELTRQKEIITRFIQQNAKEFQSIDATIRKQMKNMDAKLQNIHKTVHIVQTDTFAMAHKQYQLNYCGFTDAISKLLRFDMTCLCHWNPFHWLYDFWHKLSSFLLQLLQLDFFYSIAGILSIKLQRRPFGTSYPLTMERRRMVFYFMMNTKMDNCRRHNPEVEGGDFFRNIFYHTLQYQQMEPECTYAV